MTELDGRELVSFGFQRTLCIEIADALQCEILHKITYDIHQIFDDVACNEPKLKPDHRGPMITSIKASCCRGSTFSSILIVELERHSSLLS